MRITEIYSSNIGYDLDDPVLQQIGDTPIVQHPADKGIYCKLEYQNPTRSHKDRLALGMLLEMRRSGEIDGSSHIVEASSGNMAGGVALATNRLDHPCTIISPETASPIKMGYVQALGAELIQVPAVSHESDDYYQNRARGYSEENNAIYLNQYERALNPEIHYKWTGPESWAQTKDVGITHFVAATGSGGTLSGIGRYLKEQDDSITTVGVDAEQSNISRAFNNEPSREYDTEIEGLGQYRTTDAIHFDAIDTIESVPDETALKMTRKMSEEHGMLVGTSTGAVIHVAEQISAREPDSCILTIVHDGAEQYFHQIEGWS